MRQRYIARSIFSLSQIDRFIDNRAYPTSRFLGILLRVMRMCSRKVLILILRRRTREINPPGREDEKIARQNLIQSVPKRIHQNPIKSSPVDPFQEFFFLSGLFAKKPVYFFFFLSLFSFFFDCVFFMVILYAFSSCSSTYIFKRDKLIAYNQSQGSKLSKTVSIQCLLSFYPYIFKHFGVRIVHSK